MAYFDIRKPIINIVAIVAGIAGIDESKIIHTD
jgi:hypothetical protein